MLLEIAARFGVNGKRVEFGQDEGGEGRVNGSNGIVMWIMH